MHHDYEDCARGARTSPSRGDESRHRLARRAPTRHAWTEDHRLRDRNQRPSRYRSLCAGRRETESDYREAATRAIRDHAAPADPGDGRDRARLAAWLAPVA